MKNAYRICFGAVVFGFSHIALANTERSSEAEPPNPEIRPMAFDQCIELLHEYEQEMGPPGVVLDTPALRIVRFIDHNDGEQIACDGDDNVVTWLDIDDDD